MALELVESFQLDAFPGGPFNPFQIASAVARARRLAGWHIAPQVTETLEVESQGGRILVLPTLMLAAVTEVRQMTYDGPVVLDNWRFRGGGLLIRRWGYWPGGPIEADVTHGYAVCPEDLHPVLAEMAQQSAIDNRVAAEAAGPFSTTYRAQSAVDVIPAGLSPYILPSRP